VRWWDVLELWFDFSCPYAYLASRRARHLAPGGPPARKGDPRDATRGGVNGPALPVQRGRESPLWIDWRPMLLGGVFRGTGAGDGPMATLSPQKAAHNVHDMHRWAEIFAEPFRLPPTHPMRTVLALRTLLALPRPSWPAAIEAIFAAYWQRGEDVARPEVVAQALRGAGIPEDVIAAAARRTEDADIKDELRRRTDEAISLGIFGAPAWVLREAEDPSDATRGGVNRPLLIWGQDRMPWVEAVLAGWRLSGPPPGGPRPFAPRERAVAGKTLDVYFDVASPFAYLGLTQLPALAAMGVRPRLVPILLGALFRDIGQANVPLLGMPAAKQRYVGLDLARWASWWGESFDFPRKFPQRTIAAQRLCVLAAAEGWEVGVRLATALGRAMWAEQRDLEDEQVLRAIVGAAGLPEDWVARTQEPAIKAQLAEHTAAARAAGVFGVPTYIVDGTHLFWGQDRLDLVARALAGWTPP
jgi:2-hydroxychromene-2-carboxylate isomerase